MGRKDLCINKKLCFYFQSRQEVSALQNDPRVHNLPCMQPELSIATRLDY